MTEFELWCELILSESLKEQSDRMAELILTPVQWEARQNINNVTKNKGQLSLF